MPRTTNSLLNGARKWVGLVISLSPGLDLCVSNNRLVDRAYGGKKYSAIPDYRNVIDATIEGQVQAPHHALGFRNSLSARLMLNA